MYLSIICIYLFVSMCVMCVCISLSLFLSPSHSPRVQLFFLTPPVETRGFLTFFYCVHTFCGLSGWGGWGDVNVPWKRYVTYAGVGVGGVG